MTRTVCLHLSPDNVLAAGNWMQPFSLESSASSQDSTTIVEQGDNLSRKEVFLVSNPLAGSHSGANQLRRLSELLQAQGLRTEDIHSLDRIAPLVEESLSKRTLWAVVCVGGDGTVAEVVNRTPAETPLAILPRGTENLLAKYIGQPFDPPGICDMLLDGVSLRLDVGRAGERLFLLMLSAGFDAEVVRQMAATRKGHITHWNWLKPIFASLRSYQYPEMRIYWRETGKSGVPPESSTGESVSRARWAFVSNLPCYARNLPIVPQAEGTDGQLDVCTYAGGSLASGIKLLFHTMLRRQHRLRKCRMHRASSFRLEADQPIPYQVDGDFGGWLPVEVEIIRRRMNLIVPKQFAARFRRENSSEDERSCES